MNLVNASFPSGDRWYVVRTNIRCEFRAQFGLDSAGFRTFMPHITRWKRHARVAIPGKEPLFPRYFFVEADWNLQSLDTLHRTDGVESIINNNGVPSSIYGDFIFDLVERQMKGDFDHLKERPMQRGDIVQIMDGKYEDLWAVIDRLPGKKRAELLISIMGRKVRDTLGLAQIRPSMLKPKSPRPAKQRASPVGLLFAKKLLCA